MPLEPAAATWVAVVGAAALGLLVAPALVLAAQRSLQSDMRLGARVVIAAAILTAGTFALITARVGVGPLLPGYVVFTASAVPLTIVDLTERRLPNRLIVPAFVAVILLLGTGALLGDLLGALIGMLVGALALFGLYLVLAIASRGGIGLGDVKLGLLSGAATGFLGLHAWVVGLLIGVLLNGMAAVVVLLRRREARVATIPFGPSILVGALVAIVLTT